MTCLCPCSSQSESAAEQGTGFCSFSGVESSGKKTTYLGAETVIESPSLSQICFRKTHASPIGRHEERTGPTVVLLPQTATTSAEVFGVTGPSPGSLRARTEWDTDAAPPSQGERCRLSSDYHNCYGLCIKSSRSYSSFSRSNECEVHPSRPGSRASNPEQSRPHPTRPGGPASSKSIYVHLGRTERVCRALRSRRARADPSDPDCPSSLLNIRIRPRSGCSATLAA